MRFTGMNGYIIGVTHSTTDNDCTGGSRTASTLNGIVVALLEEIHCANRSLVGSTFRSLRRLLLEGCATVGQRGGWGDVTSTDYVATLLGRGRSRLPPRACR